MKYRTKPIVIEAFQMTHERRWDNRDWPEWLHAAWNTSSEKDGALFIKNPMARIGDSDYGLLCIRTLEGDHLVSWHDFIVQGVKGELYPCKPDIFGIKYEAVTDEAPSNG